MFRRSHLSMSRDQGELSLAKNTYFCDGDGDGHHHHSGTWRQATVGVRGASGVLVWFEDLIIVSSGIQSILATLGTEVDWACSFPNYESSQSTVEVGV